MVDNHLFLSLPYHTGMNGGRDLTACLVLYLVHFLFLPPSTLVLAICAQFVHVVSLYMCPSSCVAILAL